MNYSAIRARARENLRGHWKVSVAAAFVAAIFGALVATSGSNMQITKQLSEETDLKGLAMMAAAAAGLGTFNLLRLILGGVVQLGYSKFLLAQHDGTDYEVKDLFSQFDRFSVGFLQLFLRELYVILWTLLLIIPGIIKGFSYAMTPFILADHPELTASQAIRRSQELMQGHKGELFVLGLTFIGWNMLSALTLGIGSLWVNPYMNAAYAAFYRELVAEQQETCVEF